MRAGRSGQRCVRKAALPTHEGPKDLNLQPTERDTPKANELLRKCSMLLIIGKIP